MKDYKIKREGGRGGVRRESGEKSGERYRGERGEGRGERGEFNIYREERIRKSHKQDSNPKQFDNGPQSTRHQLEIYNS